jgi:CheY-like chemotaxis protein
MAKEILIADSDKADQEEFQKIFETTNYHLIFSESGEDVLFRVKLFKPDLIITSVGLKDKNGFELCEAIKTDPEYKHVPFILLSNIFEEISEEDRRRVHADGVISKPLHEDEILNLIDQLVEEESMEKRGEKMGEKEMEWKSFAEIEKTTREKTDELSLDQPALAEEEEIIELVDVVEESEVQMSIDDFTVQKKEEIWGEITPLESWGRLEEEQKPSEKEFLLPLDEKEMEIERKPSLPFEKEVKPKEAAPEEELFEKIELEEILQKVEQLRPSLEKEWPAEREERILEEEPTPIKEPTEKIFGFEEFEAALKGEVKAEHVEDELQPFFLEEPKKEVPAEAAAIEVSIEEEELKELPEEEFPEALLEEMLGAEEISVIEEPKEISLEEAKPEEEIMPEEIRIDRLEEVEAPRIIEESRPLVTMVDKQLQDLILKGVQEMVGDFITKILPEMTQNILGLTVERIEKMVKDIVPDLAEKAIQEEIKRLQKGEKG